MSEAYRIHPGSGIVLFQGGNLRRHGDWESAIVEVLHDVGPDAVRRVLSDRRAMAGYPPGTEERMAAFFRGHGRELHEVQWAVVLSGEVQARETVQLAERLSRGTGVRLRAYTNLPEALRWLLGAYEDTDITELQTWIGS